MVIRLGSDCETGGLLPELTKLRCLTITDVDARDAFDFVEQAGLKPIHFGIEMLKRADLIVGHNWIGFDHKPYNDDPGPQASGGRRHGPVPQGEGRAVPGCPERISEGREGGARCASPLDTRETIVTIVTGVTPSAKSIA